MESFIAALDQQSTSEKIGAIVFMMHDGQSVLETSQGFE